MAGTLSRYHFNWKHWDFCENSAGNCETRVSWSRRAHFAIFGTVFRIFLCPSCTSRCQNVLRSTLRKQASSQLIDIMVVSDFLVKYFTHELSLDKFRLLIQQCIKLIQSSGTFHRSLHSLSNYWENLPLIFDFGTILHKILGCWQDCRSSFHEFVTMAPRFSSRPKRELWLS